MEEYKKRLALALAETGALFFDRDLVLKDGRPTPYFINMAMFRTGRLSLDLGSFFAGMMVSRGIAGETDIILGPSYKGSSIALATAISLWKDYGMDLFYEYDRKESKKHGEGSVVKSVFVNQAFFDGCRLFVVDDVATSMGTKYDLLEKIRGEAEMKNMTIHISGVGIGVDREQTTAAYGKDGKIVPGQKGKDAIRDSASKSGVPVYSVAGVREVIEYLYGEKVPVMIRGGRSPIDEKTKQDFDEYLRDYGVG